MSGTLFRDRNRNARRDRGESPIAGARIFIDANRNGRRDANEKVASSDARGAWSFTHLPPGRYVIRVEGSAPTRASAGSIARLVLKLKDGQAVTGKLLGA